MIRTVHVMHFQRSCTRNPIIILFLVVINSIRKNLKKVSRATY